MVVPYEFNSRRTELAQKVAEKVQEGEDTTFHTIINFDNDAFNKVKKST